MRIAFSEQSVVSDIELRGKPNDCGQSSKEVVSCDDACVQDLAHRMRIRTAADREENNETCDGLCLFLRGVRDGGRIVPSQSVYHDCDHTCTAVDRVQSVLLLTSIISGV